MKNYALQLKNGLYFCHMDAAGSYDSDYNTTFEANELTFTDDAHNSLRNSKEEMQKWKLSLKDFGFKTKLVKVDMI